MSTLDRDDWNRFINFLHHKYNNFCYGGSFKIGQFFYPGLNFSDFQWNLFNPQFKLTDCLLQSKKRFVVIDVEILVIDDNLTYGEIRPISHANLLLFDRDTKEVELFEPGSYIENIEWESGYLEFLRKWISRRPGQWKFIIPRNYCPHQMGPQTREVESSLHPTENFGHCFSWVAMYLEARLINPDVSRDDIIDYLLDMDPDQLWELINRYTDNIKALNDL